MNDDARRKALDWKRLQLLINFGRWDREWGLRPLLAEIEECRRQISGAGYPMPPALPQSRDWGREAIPEASEVRAYYRSIPALYMTDAEREVSQPEVAAKVAEAMAILRPGIKRVPAEAADLGAA